MSDHGKQNVNSGEIRLGIDLGGSKILALVIGEDGKVIGRAKSEPKPIWVMTPY